MCYSSDKHNVIMMYNSLCISCCCCCMWLVFMLLFGTLGASVNYCSTCLCTVVNCDGNELNEHKSWNVGKIFKIVIFTYEFLA